MQLPRDLSGAHLAEVLCRRWRYTVVHRAGSHIILETSEPSRQRISLPDHRPVKGASREAIISSL